MQSTPVLLNIKWDHDALALTMAVANQLREAAISEVIEQAVRNILADEQANEAKTLTLEDHFSLLCSQIESAVNIQQWSPPDIRSNKTSLPQDQYYAQNYCRWKSHLVVEASGGTVSKQLSGFQLRSLLLANCIPLISELQYTGIARARHRLYEILALSCSIPQEVVQDILLASSSIAAADEAGPSSFLPSETGLGFILRDRGGAAEEDLGIIGFECICNTREPDHMVKLLTLKSIFSRQLPKMPREYITRLTFDRQHYSFCLLKKDRVIGGVCFRPFFSRKFAEIVFLAVTSSEQVKGYGTRLMNHLKDFVRHRDIEYFLTYADNFALGYFRKQGFSQRISMPKERWAGFIKDYDGGTLMECYISPTINYLHLGEIFLGQRRRVQQAMRLLKCPCIYSGAAVWSSAQWKTDGTSDMAATSSDSSVMRIDPRTIPGFAEAGWTESLRLQRKKEPLPLNDQILKIVDAMTRSEASWPFRKPVTRQEAPDYHEHIKQPMDISTIRKLAKAKGYRTKQEFGTHLKLMFDNCRYYNMQTSIYYKLADELEAYVSIFDKKAPNIIVQNGAAEISSHRGDLNFLPVSSLI